MSSPIALPPALTLPFRPRKSQFESAAHGGKPASTTEYAYDSTDRRTAVIENGCCRSGEVADPANFHSESTDTSVASLIASPVASLSSTVSVGFLRPRSIPET